MEELKLVAETLQSLGSDAKTAFIIWIVATKLVDLGWVIVAGGAVWALFNRVGQGLYNILMANRRD